MPCKNTRRAHRGAAVHVKPACIHTNHHNERAAVRQELACSAPCLASPPKHEPAWLPGVEGLSGPPPSRFLDRPAASVDHRAISVAPGPWPPPPLASRSAQAPRRRRRRRPPRRPSSSRRWPLATVCPPRRSPTLWTPLRSRCYRSRPTGSLSCSWPARRATPQSLSWPAQS